MSLIASHHIEWKSLLDISGPFLSIPVLLEVFPDGLDVVDKEVVSNCRSAYEEWREAKNEVAIHSAWIDYVLGNLLGYPSDLLLRGQSIPPNLSAYIPQQSISLHPSMVLIDPASKEPQLLIRKYDHTQDLNKPPFGEASMSCLSRMMELLHATQVPLGLITNGEDWVLVHAPVGETSSYIAFSSHFWFAERLTLRAFYTIFQLKRFFGVPDEDTLTSLFKRSAENQHEITDQLGAQVRSAVQILIQAFNKADQDANRKLLKDVEPDFLYEAAITIMMRLVFLLYAEERKLLPVNEKLYYQHYAISNIADQLSAERDQFTEDILERHYDAWSRILAISRLVFGGIRHDRLNMPAYGGSLFDPDRFAFLEGRDQGSNWQEEVAAPLLIDNRTVLHILENIQFLYIRDYQQRQRLSFRALDIEQIGHIYEGLLEYKAARADQIMIGLEGNKGYPLPYMALDELEAYYSKGIKQLSKEVNEITNKSHSAIKNALDKPIDLEFAARLRVACRNQEQLYQRVAPFAYLLREDDYQNLVIIEPGSVYVTLGSTRRATGTHYTPRSLTEPIVQHTLDPLVYKGPAEGLPQDEWDLHHPAKLLDLKICDMAMGSGSFLVQVIRNLSERLVESWEKLLPVTDPEKQLGLYLSAEGKILDTPSDVALPNDLDARYLVARRLVADRCIYGVDKNPLAVEMAKLSIWLITLDKNRPFTFLDHSLKCGDSLVGASEQDFLNWAHSTVNNTTWSLFDEGIRNELEDARAKRRELEAFDVRDITDLEMKKDLLHQAEQAVQRVKLGCDLLTGARLKGLGKTDQEAEESILLMQWMAGEIEDNPRCQTALNISQRERVFHWFLEFPEVFEKSGFDAFIGNPPFLGGLRISTTYGDNYLSYIHNKFLGKGTADLCSYFFMNAYVLISRKGNIGFIATNTISQGDSREIGFDRIISEGGIIYRADVSVKWPGTAAVYVSIIHLTNSNNNNYKKYLNGEKVETISPYLDSSTLSGNPKILNQNKDIAFNGVYVLGLGFTLEPDYAQRLIEKDPKNSDVLFPYLNGFDLNNHPLQQPSRWIINFHDWPIKKAKEYEDCFHIIREEVYEERQNKNDERARKYWWRYMRPRPNMQKAISGLNRVLVVAVTSKTLGFCFVPNDWVYDIATVVFAFQSYLNFAILQSTFHEKWVWNFSSTLKQDLRYTPGTVFQSFPFPSKYGELEQAGEKYYKFRKILMQEKWQGLTEIYNQFHDQTIKDSDFKEFREYHMGMDFAVSEAYGWDDINLQHGFHETPYGKRFTICENARVEILRRLVDLNSSRFRNEVHKTFNKDQRHASKKSTTTSQKQVKHDSQLRSTGQIELGLDIDLPSQPALEIAPKPAGALSIDQLENWSWYRCAACGTTVMGFSAKEHIQEKHGNVDVGFIKPKDANHQIID